MNFRAVFFATLQTTCLFAAGFIIPLLGQMLALITPVPLILASIRYGRREGLAALGASCVLVLALGGWQAAAVLLFGFGLIAIGIAEGMRRQMKPEEIALLGGLLPIAVVGAIIVIYLVRVGKNPLGAVEQYLRESIAEAAALYTRMGLAETAVMIKSVSDSFVHYMARLMPGIAIATSVMQAAFCYGVSRTIISRKDGPASVSGQSPFAVWYAPDAWVWGLIAALALVVLPNETSRLAGWNLAILFAVVYLAQGTAIVEHFLRRGHVGPFMRGLIIVLILALPSIVFVITLGIVDIWADFRKVRAPLQTP
jgi:uncharacterized protein YybS (DUF2232 family)